MLNALASLPDSSGGNTSSTMSEILRATFVTASSKAEVMMILSTRTILMYYFLT